MRGDRHLWLNATSQYIWVSSVHYCQIIISFTFIFSASDYVQKIFKELADCAVDKRVPTGPELIRWGHEIARQMHLVQVLINFSLIVL